MTTKTKINYYTNVGSPSLNMAADIKRYIKKELGVPCYSIEVVKAQLLEYYAGEGDAFYTITLQGAATIIKRIKAAETKRAKEMEL